MEIILQLLIWLGSGFAFACGVTLGVFLTVKVTRRDQRGETQADTANALLRERNEIGERQVQVMWRIAESMEMYRKG